jgi:hypothetical protein
MPENTTSWAAGAAVLAAGVDAGLVVGVVMGTVMVSEVHTLAVKVVSKKQWAAGRGARHWPCYKDLVQIVSRSPEARSKGDAALNKAKLSTVGSGKF